MAFFKEFVVTLIVFVFMFNEIKSQPGPTSSSKTYCDINGGNATYSETLLSSNTLRNISASGCPNHYNPCLKPSDVCSSDTTEATFQNHKYQIKAYPCFANATYNTTCIEGAIGILRNGVVIYSQSGNAQSCSDAVDSEGDTFDRCGGHADNSGIYHYHIPPTCLLKQLNIVETQSHGDIIGWALDGFPIYGPYGQSSNMMFKCSDTTRANQNDCVDSCGGHSQHVVGNGYLYHYHMIGNVSDGVTDPVDPLPSSYFNPYSIGCFKGVLTDYSYVDTTNIYQCTSNGYNSTFSPEILSGVTTVYSSTDSSSNTNTFSFVIICVIFFAFMCIN